MQKKILFIGAGAIALCGAVALEITSPPTPRLIYNKSESAAIGWYIVKPEDAVNRDVTVAAFAPDNARNLAAERGYLPAHIPLIKTVWAGPGDELCALGRVITTPGRPDIVAFKSDRLKRPMPSWKGCITLKRDEFFLVSTRIKTSFDSRYFGPVRRENILGTAHFLGPNSEKPEGLGAADGRARVERQ